MLQNLQRDMQGQSQPAITAKLTKAGTVTGIAVAGFLLIGSLFSNITHLDAGILISSIVAAVLMGAIVCGIIWGIGSVLGGTVAAKNRMIQTNLSGKYNKINGELQQINQEIRRIEPGKKENDTVCASIEKLKKDLETLRKKLYQEN